MGSYTNPSGGGGGAIYKDGDPVAETLAGGESVTVPAGETWDVTIHIYDDSGDSTGDVEVAGQRLAKVGSSVSLEQLQNIEIVIDSGQTIKSGNSNVRVNISGYAV